MTLASAAVLGFALQCAPNVAPQTVVAIVRTESRGNPLALNVNGSRQPARQVTAANAAATARRYIAAGYSVDLGLGQINSRNMRRLGLTWDTIFDPCTNIEALGRILSENYRAVANGRHPQTALRMALSMYNTGSASRGFRNGYVAKVVGNADATDNVVANGVTEHHDELQPVVAAANPRDAIVGDNETSSAQNPIIRPPAAWNVFEHATHARKTLAQSVKEERMILWTF